MPKTAARKARERDAARVRQARKRANDAEKARLRAIAEASAAERQERLDERVVSSVLRHPVMTASRRGPPISVVTAEFGQTWVEGDVIAEPRMLVGRRVLVVDGKPTRPPLMADSVNTLDLQPREKRAALMFQADWREVGAGLNVGAVDYLRSTGGAGDGSGAHTAMRAQIDTRARLEGAVTHLGAFAPSVARVVLDGVPVSYWAEEAGKTFQEARAWFVLALQRLAGFYWPPKLGSGPVLLMFGPPRDAYETSEAEIIRGD